MTNRILLSLGLVAACLATAPAQEPAIAPPPGWSGAEWALAGPEFAGPSARRTWVRGQYLLGWVDGQDLPALVTTSPVGTAQPVAGVLGQPTTLTLFGGRVNDGPRSGARIAAGHWFSEGRIGIEADVFVVGSDSTVFNANSVLTPIIGRPFTNGLTNLPDAILVAFPANSTGSVTASVSSGYFYHGRIDAVERMIDREMLRFDGLIGYRYYQYGEALGISQTLVPTGAAGTQVISTDEFQTRNTFHGMDMGVRAMIGRRTLWAELHAALAFGGLNRTMSATGNQVTTATGLPPVQLAGGMLAVGPNQGTRTGSDEAIVADLGIGVGWRIRPALTLRFGYDALFLHRAARIDTIDTTINPEFFPPVQPQTGPDRPAFNLARPGLWVQTLFAGAELRF